MAHRPDAHSDDAAVFAAKLIQGEDGVTTLATLTRLGERQRFGRDDEIYGERSRSTHWYQIVSGTVRLTTVLADGRRHVGGFCFEGDCFGFELDGAHALAAEAVEPVVVYRNRRQSIGSLIGERPELAQQLWNRSLRDLSHARAHNNLLGRMAAPVRVVGFLLDIAARRGTPALLRLPMSRIDIADYLGMTVETVCRVLSRLTELRLIVIPDVHQVEFIDTHALETIFLEGFAPKFGCHYGSRRRRVGETGCDADQNKS